MAIGRRNVSVKASAFNFTQKKTMENEIKEVEKVEQIIEKKVEEKPTIKKKKLRFGSAEKENKPPQSSKTEQESQKEEGKIFKIGNKIFDMEDGRYGRKKWPPMPGESYYKFLEWATDDTEFFEFISDTDEALAIFMWMGKLPHPGEKPENFVEDIEDNKEEDYSYQFNF